MHPDRLGPYEDYLPEWICVCEQSEKLIKEMSKQLYESPSATECVCRTFTVRGVEYKLTLQTEYHNDAEETLDQIRKLISKEAINESKVS